MPRHASKLRAGAYDRKAAVRLYRRTAALPFLTVAVLFGVYLAAKFSFFRKKQIRTAVLCENMKNRIDTMPFIVYNKAILEKYVKEKVSYRKKEKGEKKDGKETEESVYDHGTCDRDRGDRDPGGGADPHVYESY